MSSTLPPVLCVDDEAHILKWQGRLLSRHFEVVPAADAAQALAEIARRAPFAAVVLDLNMPEMDGIEFLSLVRQRSPDTTRVLLTGTADLAAAIDAVNRGAVFRFLTKPCDSEVLLQTVVAAVEQYRLVTAERVLLEQTLHGSIKALTDLLALVNPAGFGRALRTRDLVRAVAEKLGVHPLWDLEVAAMLTEVGSVTLPAHTVEKLYSGGNLTLSEEAAVEGLPLIAREMIAAIPRLESVREILTHQNARADRPGTEGAGREEVPLGARILKAAIAYDRLEIQGMRPADIVAALARRPGWYDPDVLRALGEVRGEAKEQIVFQLPLSAVQPGMIIAEDIKAPNGVLLVARGQEVSARLLMRITHLIELIGPLKRVHVILPVAGGTLPTHAAGDPPERRAG